MRVLRNRVKLMPFHHSTKRRSFKWHVLREHIEDENLERWEGLCATPKMRVTDEIRAVSCDHCWVTLQIVGSWGGTLAAVAP